MEKPFEKTAFDALFKDILSNPLTQLEALARKQPLANVRDAPLGRTLLHMFALTEHGEHCLDYLLRQHKISPNLANKGQRTALHTAAIHGNFPVCQVLVRAGADVDAMDDVKSTALDYAIQYGNEPTARFLLSKSKAKAAMWDTQLLERICDAKMVTLVHEYMDHFRKRVNDRKPDGSMFVAYLNAHQVYGHPLEPVATSPLAIIVSKSSIAPDVLSHGLMTYIMNAKWSAFARRYFLVELAIYVVLLVSTYVTLVLVPVMGYGAQMYDIQPVLQWIAIICASISLCKEARELQSEGWRQYLTSVFNWLNLSTYCLILIAIIMNAISIDGDRSHFVHFRQQYGVDMLFSIAIVLLCLSSVEYLQLLPFTDLLVTMMLQMVRDVFRFIMLFVMFLMGFTAAFYILLYGEPRFENYPNALVATFFMLFGDFGPDVFLALSGARWVVANVLVLFYLTSVLVMLLNILIAMMSTRYESVRDRAFGERNRARAEAIVRIESSLPQRTRVKAYNALIKSDVTRRCLVGKVRATSPTVTDVAEQAKAVTKPEGSAQVVPLQPLTTTCSPPTVATEVRSPETSDTAGEGASREIGGGQERPPPERVIGGGQERPPAERVIGGGQERPPAERVIGGGQERPPAERVIGGGQERPPAERVIGGGQERRPAERVIGGGQERRPAGSVIGGRAISTLTREDTDRENDIVAARSLLDVPLRMMDFSITALPTLEDGEYRLDDVKSFESVGSTLPWVIEQEMKELKHRVDAIYLYQEYAGGLQERTFLQQMDQLKTMVSPTTRDPQPAPTDSDPGATTRTCD